MTVITDERFWRIVERSKKALPMNNPHANRDPQCQELAKILEKMPREDIVGFDRRFDVVYAKAMQWDLVLAFYVLTGCAGDDAFDEFVKGLISSGKKIFCEAICSPDTALAKHGVLLQEVYNLRFAMVAYEVYKRKFGEPLPDNDRQIQCHYVGTPFNVDDFADLKERAPKLWDLYGAARWMETS